MPGAQLRLSRHLRQPEIQNLCVTAVRDEDVGGLDVPVNDPFRVRGVERVRNFSREPEERFDLERLSGDPVLQRLPFRSSIAMKGCPSLLNIVNRANVWVIECRSGLGLALEAFASAGSFSISSGKNLSATSMKPRSSAL